MQSIQNIHPMYYYVIGYSAHNNGSAYYKSNHNIQKSIYLPCSICPKLYVARQYNDTEHLWKMPNCSVTIPPHVNIMKLYKAKAAKQGRCS